MKNRGMRRTLIGMVVSDKLDKTVVVRVERLVKRGEHHVLGVYIESSRVEIIEGRSIRVRVEERFTFRRHHEATSLEPEAMRRLGCPNCGVSIETTRMGACPNCDTPGGEITSGQELTLVELEGD